MVLAECPHIDVNWQDSEGNTALITAAQAGKTRLFLPRVQAREQLPGCVGALRMASARDMNARMEIEQKSYLLLRGTRKGRWACVPIFCTWDSAHQCRTQYRAGLTPKLPKALRMKLLQKSDLVVTSPSASHPTPTGAAGSGGRW